MTRRLSILVIAVLLSLVVGCGGSSGGGGPPAEPRLTVSPTQSTATAGGATVGFTATLSGSSAAIGWTLVGPGSISAASGSATVYTPPSSVAAATSATLTASAGTGLTASATITLQPPPSITVTGNILESGGLPIAAIHALIGTTVVDTDASGHFSIPGVTPPYDLITLDDSNKTVSIYQGLTRPDPTITIGRAPVLPRQGTVTGMLSGGDNLTAPGHSTRLAWGSPQTSTANSVGLNPFSLTLAWDGPSSITGTIHALQWTTVGTGPPTGYTGYGKTENIPVASGGTTSMGADVVMAAPTSTGHLTGSATGPPSLTIGRRELDMVFDDGATIPIVSQATTAADFDWLVPVVTGSTFQIVYSAADPLAGYESFFIAGGLTAGATSIPIPLPAAVSLLTPDDGATSVGYGTNFSWSPTAGVHAVVIEGRAQGDDSYFIFTTGTTTRLPDLSQQGYALAKSYEWNVDTFAPFDTIDQYTATPAHAPAGNSSSLTYSASRGFVTTPAD